MKRSTKICNVHCKFQEKQLSDACLEEVYIRKQEIYLFLGTSVGIRKKH